jgi:uncharacterized BrkB/YihY/UPF0761 family membrane protein
VKLRAVGGTLREFAKRVWSHSVQHNVPFLASGIAFDLLLAIVPFVLLLITGATFLLNLTQASSTEQAMGVIDQMLPPHEESADSPVHRIIADSLGAHKSLGIVSALTFVASSPESCPTSASRSWRRCSSSRTRFLPRTWPSPARAASSCWRRSGCATP